MFKNIQKGSNIKQILSIIILTIVLSALTINAVSDSNKQGEEQTNYKTLLYSSVFAHSNPLKLNIKKVPENIRDRIVEYLGKCRNYKSKLKKPKSNEELYLFKRKQLIVKPIVTLINDENIENIAVDYANKAKIYYEWEGDSSAPLDEAKFAEEFLKENPKTPIKAYLFLFVAHRYGCASECLLREQKHEEQKEMFKKYELYIKKAKEFSDPLIKIIAEGMEQQPYLYVH